MLEALLPAPFQVLPAVVDNPIQCLFGRLASAAEAGSILVSILVFNPGAGLLSILVRGYFFSILVRGYFQSWCGATFSILVRGFNPGAGLLQSWFQSWCGATSILVFSILVRGYFFNPGAGLLTSILVRGYLLAKYEHLPDNYSS